MADCEYEIPNDDDVTADDIQFDADLAGADLRNADLSGADLMSVDLKEADFEDADFRGADLSRADIKQTRIEDADFRGANFRGADLSGARLSDVKFSNTVFTNTNLTGASFLETTANDALFVNTHLTNASLSGTDFINSNFVETDLTNADLQRADFTGSNLVHCNLSEADIRGANLRDTDLRGSIISDLRIDAHTRLGTPKFATPPNDVTDWDSIARYHHDLKLACNDNSLINKARKQHYFERRARGYEQKDAIDLNPWFTATWLGSFLSRVFIGYGVRVRRLLATMAILFVGSTAVYLTYGVGGDAAIDTISYSVRAFTVAPPTAPEQFLPHLVMMIETFFGTLSIVLLGYVLSNREQF